MGCWLHLKWLGWARWVISFRSQSLWRGVGKIHLPSLLSRNVRAEMQFTALVLSYSSSKRFLWWAMNWQIPRSLTSAVAFLSPNLLLQCFQKGPKIRHHHCGSRKQHCNGEVTQPILMVLERGPATRLLPHFLKNVSCFRSRACVTVIMLKPPSETLPFSTAEERKKTESIAGGGERNGAGQLTVPCHFEVRA